MRALRTGSDEHPLRGGSPHRTRVSKAWVWPGAGSCRTAVVSSDHLDRSTFSSRSGAPAIRPDPAPISSNDRSRLQSGGFAQSRPDLRCRLRRCRAPQGSAPVDGLPRAKRQPIRKVQRRTRRGGLLARPAGTQLRRSPVRFQACLAPRAGSGPGCGQRPALIASPGARPFKDRRRVHVPRGPAGHDGAAHHTF